MTDKQIRESVFPRWRRIQAYGMVTAYSKLPVSERLRIAKSRGFFSWKDVEMFATKAHDACRESWAC